MSMYAFMAQPPEISNGSQNRAPVTIQSRVAIGGPSPGRKLVVGLGARPSRAGSPVAYRYRASISLAIPEFGIFCNLHSAIRILDAPLHLRRYQRSWSQAEWTGAQTMGTLGLPIEPFLLQTFTHPSLKGYWKRLKSRAGGSKFTNAGLPSPG